MMEKELYDLLEKEDKVIQSLISAAKFKQKVIVQNDYEGLDRVNANESALLSNLDKISRSQQKLVSRLFDINSLKENGKPRILSILVNEYKELFKEERFCFYRKNYSSIFCNTIIVANHYSKDWFRFVWCY